MRNDVAHVGDDTCKQSADNAGGTDYKELPALLINRIGVICVICGYVEMLATQTLTNQDFAQKLYRN